MTLPKFPDKHGASPVIDVEDHLDHLSQEPSSMPEAVILTFQPRLTEWVAERAEREGSFGEGRLYVIEKSAVRIGVLGNFGIGSAVTAAVVEQLAALGVRTVVILGGCGSLQPDIHGEEALVVDEAIRDEGVSHHYLEPDRTVAASPAIVTGLERAASESEVDYRVGPTWTTDAIYRETVPEVEHYADEGILGVEMEAAALFAVARYRDLDAGAVVVAFDALTTDEWTPRIDGERRLERLFPVVSTALVSHVTD